MTKIAVSLLALTLFAVCVSALGHQECSGQGRKFSDVGVCECYECFTGPQCETRLDSCLVVATGGDPGAFTDYWIKHDQEGFMATEAAYRNTYQFNTVYYGDAPLPGIGKALVPAIKDLHALVGNVKTDGYHVVPGHGCTNLIAAIQYAYAKLAGKTMKVFAQTPYYNGYKSWANSGSRHVEFSEDLNLDPEEVIEFVTVPNNPDGLPRKAHYKSKYLVHDMVYNWPSLTNTTKLADHDVMLFSLSKMSGHGGTRFGWALVKDKDVAQLMGEFIGLAEIHVGIDAQHRALQLINAILKNKTTFFDDIREKMTKRWARAESILKKNPERFELKAVSGQFYLWVKCKTDRDCLQTFKNAGIQGLPGSEFGADATYTRVSMVQNDVMFEILMERLNDLVSSSASPRIRGSVI